jgi:hypothetical protein
MKNLSLSPRTWLAVRFTAFPLAVLLPFFLVRFSGAYCTIEPNQAVSLYITSPPNIFAVIAWILVCTFLVISFMQRSAEKKQLLQRAFVVRQLIISACSIAATVPVYLWMRLHGQNNQFSTWWCDEKGTLHGSAPHTHFGLGFTPSTVVLMAALYMAVPAIKYYLTYISRRHVGGVSKKDLFQ